MTRKDFEAIASTIANTRNDDFVVHNGTLDALAENMADMLAATNARFDRARFLAAAGVE